MYSIIFGVYKQLPWFVPCLHKIDARTPPSQGSWCINRIFVGFIYELVMKKFFVLLGVPSDFGSKTVFKHFVLYLCFLL
jgi:hypothetical protein